MSSLIHIWEFFFFLSRNNQQQFHWNTTAKQQELVFDSFPTNEHFSLKWNNLLIVKQNQISASALCVYVDSYFLAVQDVNERFLFFSSPSRNQVNTPQSKTVIFPFKYGKCKHKNIYTSVKLLSQREYTISKRKALAPLHPKGSCQSFWFQPWEVLCCNGPFSSWEMATESTVSPTHPYI